jgi:PAS domain S-box-containing protein
MPRTGEPTSRRPLPRDRDSSPSDLASDPLILQQVRGEQIRTLSKQSAPVLLGNVVNAAIVSAVLWSQTSHSLLLGWTGVVALMALGRIEMRRRYWAAQAASAVQQEIWGMRFTLGSLCAGLLWGFAGGVLMPQSLPHQVMIVFVVGGMAAGAAGSISCYMPAFYAYLIPALVPTVARLFSYGERVHFGMGAMLLLFTGLLAMVARNVHRALFQAFRLGFENAILFREVSKTQASLVEANENLLRSNEQLETHVRQRTEELRASRQQLAEIVDESPDAIVVLDDFGRIISANPAMQRISGRPLESLVGHHFAATDMLLADDRKRALEVFAGVIAGEERPPQEFRIVRPDGQPLIIEVKLRVVRGLDGQQRVHTVSRDVSERHRLQRLKEAYENRLREAERLESVGMLAGGVAHDFNNLLTMILSNVDLMDRWADRDSKALLGEIRHGSLQAANLTKQLLAFSRKQLLDVKPTDLATVVSNARAMFERALGEQSTLTVVLPIEPTVVLVDATQIEQALLNLLVNARHAMPDGGQVELAMQLVNLDRESDWPDVEPGPYVRLAVSDTGTGMDEATRSRVFEPFFTTKELGHGSGLGLSSVHGLVKQAGGHIRVTSEPARGSRFEIVLPLHAAPAPEWAKGEPAAFCRGSGTVLVVEDQEQVRRALGHLLESAGYQVISAENAEVALSVTRKREGVIDLLVTDVIMPGVSGIELSRRLLAMYPHLAVLLVSGYAGTEIKVVAELGENVQFLQKPFDAVSLTSAARAALQRAQAASLRVPACSEAQSD